MTGESLRVEFRRQVRERVLDTASEHTVERGWDQVRIGEVATAAGVSRPTLYREFGNKDGVGEALVAREAQRFFDGVGALLDEQTDAVAGVRAATGFTLSQAADNPLLRAILTGNRADNVGLLPYLTTRSESIIARGRDLVGGWVAHHHPDYPPGIVDETVDAVVRLVISHLVSPGATADVVADRMGHLAAALFAQN